MCPKLGPGLGLGLEVMVSGVGLGLVGLGMVVLALVGLALVGLEVVGLGVVGLGLVALGAVGLGLEGRVIIIVPGGGQKCCSHVYHARQGLALEENWHAGRPLAVPAAKEDQSAHRTAF